MSTNHSSPPIFYIACFHFIKVASPLTRMLKQIFIIILILSSVIILKMDILYPIFCIIAASFLLLVSLFSFLMFRTFVGKSAKCPDYPPVKGTVFHQLLHFRRLYDYQTDMAKKHKTVRLLSPDQSEIYTADHRNVEHVLKTNFSNYTKGKVNQEILSELLGQGMLMVDGEKWRQQRKLASVEFSTRVLRDFSCSVFRRKAAKLVAKIREEKQGFDVQGLLMRCMLDSIFEVGFGVELNSLEGSDAGANEFIDAFDDSNEIVYYRYVDPLWKLKRYLNLGGEATLKKNIKFIRRFADDLIKTKRHQMDTDQHSVKEDILSRFLVESKKDPETMTNQYLRDVILTFMFAGKDTTANTLSWFIYILCINPLIQDKIALEVENIITSDDDFVECISNEALEEMHYLHATLTETLRLYPAVPVDGRVAETDDTLPDGFRVRKGDGVYYVAYAMGRMPYIWGDDAEEFKPERWIKDGVFQPESPFKFVAFNAGPRTCLGREFAYRQMKIMAAALLHFFRFRLSDETEKVTYRTMLTLQISGGLNVCAVPRTRERENLR